MLLGTLRKIKLSGKIHLVCTQITPFKRAKVSFQFRNTFYNTV